MYPITTLPGFPELAKNRRNTSYPFISSLNTALSTTGKTIAITGGESKIGVKAALSFAQAGISNIAILGRREVNLVTTAESICSQLPKTNAFKKVLESFSTIDVMISNAGCLSNPIVIPESDEKNWWKRIETNVLGKFNIIRTFVLLTSSSSVFINISSG
ncbi:hypothetical protein BGZ60DRAFT_525121 [Tricladium varicosporioides]|nr:hypothetical protein BGZ60DRAFT_525121 [Hymenoscyphus varicosporioides]